jgi:hypothetical protein
VALLTLPTDAQNFSVDPDSLPLHALSATATPIAISARRVRREVAVMALILHAPATNVPSGI